MKILIKYLKPYTLLLLVAITLLFVQAYTNLALPDYMSDIVNIGIQQGGIIDAVPLVVRESTMERLLLFIDDNGKSKVLENYRVVEPGSDEVSVYGEDFPGVVKESVYFFVDGDSDTRKILNSLLGRSWLALKASEGYGGKISGAPESMSLTMVNQAAVRLVREEYRALGMNTRRIQMDSIVHTGILMLLFTVISALAAVTTGFLSARIASGYARDIRLAVFEHVENFSAGEFDRFSTASLITRTTNDVMQLQTLMVMLVTMVFYAPIIGIGGIIRAIGKSRSMWWIIALAVVILIIIIFTIYKISVPKFSLLQRLMDKLNLVGRETLSGMMVIRAFNRQQYEEKRFDDVNKALTETMLFVNRVTVIMMPLMMFIMNGVSLIILWIGSKQVAASNMQVGDMMAFMQYAMQIVSAFFMLSMMFIMLPRAAVSARRIAEVLSVQPSIKDPDSPGEFKSPFLGVIEFRDVSFRYPGAAENAVSSISFTARPGEVTALIGTTGAGKSTLVHLIPRFHDVCEGAVFVGGEDVRKVSQHELRKKISYIPQKSVLFSGTIAENLRYGDEIAGGEIIREAVETAQAEDFINSFPDKMNADISQGGKNISGGQKQRLSIARALVKRAPVYIFDDSFSSLDFKTDAMLRRELKTQLHSSTLIIVAQRISTIMDAAQIVVLDKGKIIGKGTHTELMKSCRVYREIAEAQLTEEKPA